MSFRLFRPENRPDNLLTPVRKTKRSCSSQSLIAPYRSRRKSRLARASSRSPSADRLVVLVHQHDRPLPGALVQRQAPETDRRPGGARFEAGLHLRLFQLRFHGFPNAVRDDEIAPAEAEPHDGAPTSPTCRARRGPGTTPRFPRTASAACPPTGSCRTGADATGNSNRPLRRGGANGPSCRRSSSPSSGFSRGRSCRPEACVSSESRPPRPSRSRRSRGRAMVAA